MPEPYNPNGHPSLHPPAPYDILLRIDNRLSETTSRLGGLETGQRITLQAVEKAFDRIGIIQDRVSRLEASGHGPTEPPVSRLKYLAEVLPPIREILIAILLLAAGFGLTWAPTLTEVTQFVRPFD